MSDKNRIFTIRGVVMSVINELRLSSVRDYEYLEQLAIEGFRELKLFTSVSLEVEYLTMNAAKMVTLPSDYEQYSKIGIRLNGQIWTLTANDKIAMPSGVTKCGDPINESLKGEGLGYYGYVGHTHNGRYVDSLYSVGGGFNISYYRVDRRNNTILFSNDVPRSEIVLEYVSNGRDICGNTFIPAKYLEAVKRLVHWKRVEFREDIGVSSKNRRLRLFEDALDKAWALENYPTKDEVMDVLWSGLSQGIKR